MKRTLLLIFCFATFANVSAQAPEITGDVMLCPYTDGTATVTNPIYDSYQWYSKYWFTSDPYVAIAGATGPSFTYDWFTYDQSLFKVVTTLNGTTYESNEIQIDSYAWASFSVGTELNEFVSTDPNNGNLLLCSGASFTASIFMPYDFGIQWYKNGVPISGANEMDYVITGPGLYHVENARHRLIRIFGGNKIEIALAVWLGKIRYLALIDPVGACDDLALGGLPKHFRQSHNRNCVGSDDISQYLPGPDGRQLVDISDDQERRMIRNGLEERMRKRDVDH